MAYTLAAAGVLLALFLLVWLRNKASWLGGFLFCLFILALGASYLVFVARAGIPWLDYTLVAVALLVGAVMLFGLYVLIAGLLLNARLMRQRERHSLQNSLTLLLGLALLAFLVVSFFFNRVWMPVWAQALWMGLIAVLLFYFFHIFVFLVSVLLCNLARPRKKQDYIVVLGAALMGNKVSPLLGRRVDKAVAFYYAQLDRRAPPKIIMSGGQGSDERLAEAEAMRNHAMEKGVPAMDILLEDKSTNTWENMVFSKALMDERAAGVPYRCIYATSNYHLLRSGMLAKKAGVPMSGIGCRTALYYLPNALLREYAAFFAMRKKLLLAAAGAAFAVGVGLYLLGQWAQQFVI